MGRRAKQTAIRHVLLVLLLAFLGFVAFDYVSYHSRGRRAMTVVSDLGGRAGSISGWPSGKEYFIASSGPLTDAELERLSVLNSLSGRDYVTVAFSCDLTPLQLGAAQRTLSECRVFQQDETIRED